MIGSRGAESPLLIGKIAAIVADETRVFLQGGNLFEFAGFGQFTDVAGMIFRVGAEIVDIDQPIAHGVLLLQRPIAQSTSPDERE
jgi:hypothetical protein